jgi:hypothetical protein
VRENIPGALTMNMNSPLHPSDRESYNPGYSYSSLQPATTLKHSCAIGLEERNSNGASFVPVDWKDLRFAVVVFHGIKIRLLK